MSEYQYYEFIAVDRPLSDKELDAVRSTSTRARVTRTSFVNEYHYGNFKGDPDRMVEKYFDAHLYISNFRSQRFLFRVPASIPGRSAIAAYGGAGVLELRKAGEHLLVEFNCNLDEIDEDGTQDPEGLMSSLIALREEVQSGDLRALYLGWLSGVHHGMVEDEDHEPAVPPGLRTLTAAQRTLVEFLCLDPDLLEAAAHASDPSRVDALDTRDLRRWIAGFAVKEKDELLLRHMIGEEPHLRTKLLARFKAESGASRSVSSASARTVGELLHAGADRSETRLRKQKEQADAERKRRAEDEARRRTTYLETLATRVPQTWTKIEGLIAARTPKGYDEAVRLIGEMRDLARTKGKSVDYSKHVESIVTRHGQKVNLVKKIRARGLLDE